MLVKYYVSILVGQNYKCYNMFRRLSNLSYLHKIGKEPLQLFTIGDLFEKSAELYGDNVAVVSVYNQQKITFEELLKKSNKLAAGFDNIGLKRGDRVALWMPNNIEWVVAVAAIAQAGLITVTLNPINHQKDDLELCINKVGAKALICMDEFSRLKFYDTICDLLPELEHSTPGQLSAKRTPTLQSVITLSTSHLRGTYNYYEILNAVDEASLNKLKKNKSRSYDAVSTIQYTSGTTGNPKPAATGHFQQANHALQVVRRLQWKSGTNICVQVPFFHAFGHSTILAGQHSGSTLTLPSPLYNSSQNLKTLEEEKCTVVIGTPTMFVDLINLQVKENRDIRAESAIISGAPVSPDLFKNAKKVLKLKKINMAYGMTEICGLGFQSLPDEENDFAVAKTVGHLGDHLEAKIVDGNNNILPLGVPGELCLRGYNLMLGYWEDRLGTQQIIGTDRWLRTGDQFVLQKDGYGRIVGRIKDLIIRGGENIFPKEIEDVLNTHPDVIETQVIGLSHERLGEEVCACIRLKPNVKFNQEELVDFCKDKLTSYKIPSQFRIVDSFPKTGSGKIQKRLLKNQMENYK